MISLEHRTAVWYRRGATKRYSMLKSINQWAFPYPQRMTLKQCLQLAKDAGFDGIELNYDLENDLSPKAGTREFQALRKMADDIGIAISGLCSFLYWPYSLTSNDAGTRMRESGQHGLFMATAAAPAPIPFELHEAEPWSEEERLGSEYAMLGFTFRGIRWQNMHRGWPISK